MRPGNTVIETTDQIISDGVRKGILHLYTDGGELSGNQIILKGKPVINFGSCSYLGLEFDPRLREASKTAIDNYGTQFAESRAYVSIQLYKELEEMFFQLFDANCVITPTTTLGHIANIPVLISSHDAIITDQLVHNSVNTAVKLLAGAGTHIEVVRHNRMDLLEDRIKLLRNKHQKIWYLADGIYSMFGDTAPMDEIYQLLDKYPCLQLYIDDAHGMSIHGKNGRGSVLDKRMFHPKMVMATSLAKAFAYADEKNFPFLHTDQTPDVLSPFFDSTAIKPNIVFIIVEGLGRSFTNEGARLGNFTPFLDSLSRHSLYWPNFLSEGGRTFAVRARFDRTRRPQRSSRTANMGAACSERLRRGLW